MPDGPLPNDAAGVRAANARLRAVVEASEAEGRGEPARPTDLPRRQLGAPPEMELGRVGGMLGGGVCDCVPGVAVAVTVPVVQFPHWPFRPPVPGRHWASTLGTDIGGNWFKSAYSTTLGSREV